MPTQPAIVGTARVGNFRLGYESAALKAVRKTRVRITLAGLAGRVRVAGLGVHDAINDQPNTCALTVDNPAPTDGQILRVTLNSDTPRLLFNGSLQTIDLSYEGQPRKSVWPCTAIDDSARANRRQPFGTWTNVSATTIGQYLAGVANLSSAGIAAGLPAVSVNLDGSKGISGAFAQLARLIGGFSKFEDGVAYLFVSDTSDPPDAIDDTPGRFLDDPPIKVSSDDSQLQTRAYGKGHGESTLSDVAIGDTIVPVANAGAWFGTIGGAGKAISDTQVLAYTGVEPGGPGSIVGPSADPTLPPTLALAGGGSVDTGLHQYAVVFGSALGKSLPGPIASVTTSTTPLAAPTMAPVVTRRSGYPVLSGLEYGVSHVWAITYESDSTHLTTIGPDSNAVTLDATNDSANHYDYVSLVLPSAPPSGWNSIVTVYRKIGSTYYKEFRTVAINLSGGIYGNAVVGVWGDADMVANPTSYPPPPGTNTATSATVNVTAIAVGPSGTTYREVHRTAAGGTQLKLLTTINNNTDTGPYTDSAADSSLGVNAPASNTSGLPVTIPPAAIFDTTAPGFFGGVNGANATGGTSASPVITSALYSFVAADVGAAVYIQSGTNWIPGKYRIVSVASGAATVEGPVATVASPTQATWGIDYSALASPRLSVTDLAISAGSAVVFTSTALGAASLVQMAIGNSINVLGGIGFTVQQVVVRSTSGSNVTVDKALGTVGSTGGSGTLGGRAAPSTVAPGSATILTAGGAFPAGGGWVQAGAQVLRFTGVTGNTLTGVPASGPGAILSTVPYGTPIALLPALTGVTGIVVALVKGAPVNIWVQRDDLAAQATRAVIDAANGITPADGIYEGPPLVDERRGEASLNALCDATLLLRSTPIVKVVYACRDVKSKSGARVHIAVTGPPAVGPYDLTIDTVDISEIDVAPGVAPKFLVTASNVAGVTLDGLVRRLLAASA